MFWFVSSLLLLHGRKKTCNFDKETTLFSLQFPEDKSNTDGTNCNLDLELILNFPALFFPDPIYYLVLPK